MTDSQRYLKELRKELKSYIDQIKSLTNKDDHKELRALLQEISKTEKDLRKGCEIGAQYNVVHNQIQALLDTYNTSSENHSSNNNLVKNCPRSIKRVLSNDEQRVYVYLYNAQGGDIASWRKLLLPSSLMEHSINRPIYVDEEPLKKMLESKSNRTQHAYISAVINKDSVIRQYNLDESTLIDGSGHKLLRLKEGALKLENIDYFWQDGKQYLISKDGALIPCK